MGKRTTEGGHDLPELVNISQAARLLDVSRRAVHRLIATGALDGYRLSEKTVRVSVESIRAHVKRSAMPKPPAMQRRLDRERNSEGGS